MVFALALPMLIVLGRELQRYAPCSSGRSIVLNFCPLPTLWPTGHLGKGVGLVLLNRFQFLAPSSLVLCRESSHCVQQVH